MRKLLSLFGALLLFMLVWAAGHDILKGEADVWMEYTFVISSMALAVIRLIRFAKVKNSK
jgi:hypothetical protein